MTANVDAMVRAGVEAYRNGSKDEARTLLERAIELDTYNEMAWLWLSAVVETPEEQRTCLENVVVINPKNERARQGLKSLGVDPDSIASPTSGQSASTTAASYASTSTYAPSSPAPAARKEDFDNWVEGIGIDQNKAASPSGGALSSSATDLFGDAEFSADASFQFDEDILYGDENYDEEYSEEDLAGEEYDEAAYDTEYASEEDFADNLYADRNTYDDFNEAVTARMLDEEDEDEFATDPLAPRRSAAPRTTHLEDEPERTAEKNPFTLIPKDIKATRLPGVDEPAPTGAYAVIGLLGILNVVALGLLVFRIVM